MGRRKPCCDKETVKKGTWSAEEDAILRAYAEKLPTVTNWVALPNKIGLNRCGKSCRLRWLNYLRPNIKHGKFSEEEDKIISDLYSTIGSRWSVIAEKLPGRTDNDIKNYWNTKLNKKFNEYKRKPRTRRSFTGYSIIPPTPTPTQFDNKNNKNKKKNDTVFTITQGDVMSTTWPSDSQLFLQQPINGGIGIQLESNYYVINSDSQDMLVRNNNDCTSQQQRGNATSADVHVSPSLKELEDLLFDNAPGMDGPDLDSWDLDVTNHASASASASASLDLDLDLPLNSDVEVITDDNSFNCEEEFLPQDILDEFSYTTEDCVFNFRSE